MFLYLQPLNMVDVAHPDSYREVRATETESVTTE